MSTSSGPLAETAAPESQEAAPKRGAMLAPLGSGDYRLLFAGQLISLIGDAFYSVAMPWYMLTQGGGAANLGLTLTAYGVTLGTATLLGGWLSDKLRPRRVMLFSDFVRAFILAGLAWLTYGGGAPFMASGQAAPLWAIASFTAALGFFDGLFMPASSVIAPDLLPDDQLQAANGLYYSLGRFAQLIGPSLAGAAVSRFGSPISFAIDALTFVVSTITLAFIRGRARRQAAQQTTTSAPADAATDVTSSKADAASAQAADSLWRYALSNSYFPLLVLVLITGNIINGAADVGFPALASGPLHTDAQGFGFMLAASGAGGLVGGLLAGPLGSLTNRGWKAFCFFLAQVVPFSVLAFAPSVYIAIVCMACFGILNGIGNVSFQTMIQRKLPRNLLGRIWGLFSFSNFATFPIAVAAAGFAIAHFGPRIVIVSATAIMGVAIIIAFFNRELREL
jgi:MFS family permease